MSKISNPAGAVRVLRSTMAKMAADYKALERKLARVTATKDREFDARVKLESNLADERVISGVFRADICEAIHALVGSYPPFEPNARALGASLLEFVRGAMRNGESQNINLAELRAALDEQDKRHAALIDKLESDESSRGLTLAEDNAIVDALSESRLGDMPPVEAVTKALRAEALEPIVVTRPSLPALPPGPFLRGEYRLMREYRPS